jgi:membrane protein DedA with SNARE-associated domain
LIGVFSLLIALFAVGLNYLVLAIAAVAGILIGYLIGKTMERQARKK